MNLTNFVQTGGFPLKAERLQELQTAYSVFNQLGFLAGDLTIISGCTITGTNVSDGFVFINGEVLSFKGAFLSNDVIIVENEASKEFENGEIKTVHFERYATFGTAETSWLWTDFKRPIQTKELTGIFQTINNSLSAITTKLDTIEEGAKVQLQADFAQTDASKKDFIKNKQLSQPFLYKGEFNIGDVFDEDLLNVTIPDVGTANYMVLGGLLSKKADWTQDANVWHQTREHARTSFKLMLTELSGGRFQNLSFQFVIVAL